MTYQFFKMHSCGHTGGSAVSGDHEGAQHAAEDAYSLMMDGEAMSTAAFWRFFHYVLLQAQ